MVETVEPRGSRDEKHVLCAFIYGAACHRESRPGHRDPCGGWEVLSVMADNVAIISPPTSWREAAHTLGGMFSDRLLLDFLYPKMFFLPLQTRSHSSAAGCPQSSSCCSFFFWPQWSTSSASSVPTSGPLRSLTWNSCCFFLSFSGAFSCGSQDLLGKTLHLPAGHIFQTLSMMWCVRPSATFSPLKQLLRA